MDMESCGLGTSADVGDRVTLQACINVIFCFIYVELLSLLFMLLGFGTNL